ncbi:MAG: MlaD family protein [Solirubrobacterales bacterium]
MKKLNPKPYLERLTHRSRRIVALVAVATAAVVVVVSSIGAGGDDDYRVRVQFKNAGPITTGADVRVAGANVGTIEKIFVSRNDEAAVVLRITDPAFKRFYEDATCKIRLQSLIGERFIDCDPGTPVEAELREDPTDENRRLMLSNKTSAPVDIDELLDAMREPQRERFRVIINELGITLTGRGQDLQDILNRFDPTFKEVNDILKILARENKQLETLAVDGDRSLQALAKDRKSITGLFKNADKAARATNAKRAELAETLARLPAFLDELEPTAKILKNFADQAAPVAASARAAAPDLSTFVTGTNEFVKEANPALTRFGKSADIFRAQIPAIQPLADILRVISDNRGSVTNLRKLLEGFEDQKGYDNLASLAIGLAGAANGKDSFGHFIRSALTINSACFTYAQQRSKACAADFGARDASNLPPSNSASSSAAAASSNEDYDKSGASASRLSQDAAALDYLLGGER